nr:MAG TPA: hypothetical protein [Caudoviricetes sp.]
MSHLLFWGSPLTFLCCSPILVIQVLTYHLLKERSRFYVSAYIP